LASGDDEPHRQPEFKAAKVTPVSIDVVDRVAPNAW
jgi:hypothetical protein